MQSKSRLYCALKGQRIIKKWKGQGRIKIREQDNIVNNYLTGICVLSGIFKIPRVF